MHPETGLTADDLARLLGRAPEPVKWDRLLVDPESEPEPQEPGPDAPLAERLIYWSEREVWAKTSAEHAAAVSALERLRTARHVAAEPAPAPPAVAPPTRTVMIKEVLARDSAGLISKIKEYQITEPLPPDGATAPPSPAVQAPGHETAPEIARPV